VSDVIVYEASLNEFNVIQNTDRFVVYMMVQSLLTLYSAAYNDG